MVHGRSKTSEQEARKTIDKMLDQSGWDIQDVEKADIHAKKRVALREFSLNPGHGFEQTAQFCPACKNASQTKRSFCKML